MERMIYEFLGRRMYLSLYCIRNTTLLHVRIYFNYVVYISDDSLAH